MKTLSSVANFYERYSYPNYPLFAKPIYQEACWASSLFSAKLLLAAHGKMAPVLKEDSVKNILVAGCGEILPYALRKLEPSTSHLHCVDLSQKSLTRAKIRLIFDLKKTNFLHIDLNEYLKSVEGTFAHVDAYGVLHHLASPKNTIGLLASKMEPFSTIRLMVYNTESRNWIHHLQMLFRLLKIDTDLEKNWTLARNLVIFLAEEDHLLKEKLSPMASILNNKVRFIDTFLHTHVIRYSIKEWFETLNACSLKPFGLFDRYGELDHLENPLWKMPSADALERLAIDGVFENNLEILAYKCPDEDRTNPLKCKISESKACSGQNAPLFSFKKIFDFKKLKLGCASPAVLKMALRYPKFWFQFQETKDIPVWHRYWLWFLFLKNTYGKSRAGVALPEKLAKRLSDSALGRLCRLGAVAFPPQRVSGALDEHKGLLNELAKTDHLHSSSLKGSLSKDLVEKFCIKWRLITGNKDKLNEKTIKQIDRRLEALFKSL